MLRMVDGQDHLDANYRHVRRPDGLGSELTRYRSRREELTEDLPALRVQFPGQAKPSQVDGLKDSFDTVSRRWSERGHKLQAGASAGRSSGDQLTRCEGYSRQRLAGLRVPEVRGCLLTVVFRAGHHASFMFAGQSHVDAVVQIVSCADCDQLCDLVHI